MGFTYESQNILQFVQQTLRPRIATIQHIPSVPLYSSIHTIIEQTYRPIYNQLEPHLQSEETIHAIGHLCNQKSSKRWAKEHPNHPNCSTIQTYWSQNRLFYGDFVPIEIQELLETHTISKFTYVCEYDPTSTTTPSAPSTQSTQSTSSNQPSLHYQATIVLYTHQQSVSPNILREIFTRIFTMCMLDRRSSCNHVTLHLYLSDCKKEIKNQQVQCWSYSNINTGATYAMKCSEIVIWRKQENLKTIYHEIIHSFLWDIDNDEEEEQINQECHAILNITASSQVKIYEAYTEYWATILNAYTVSVLSQKTVEELIQAEQLFCMFQVAKILHLNGCHSWMDFLHTANQSNQSSQSNQSKLCFETDIFSYFIIKSALLWGIQVPLFPFSQHSSTSLMKLWKQIKRVWTSTSYQTTIQSFIEICGTLPSKDLLYKTMRMTACEYLSSPHVRGVGR